MGIYGLAEGSDILDALGLAPVSLVDGEIQEVYFLFRDRGRVLDGRYCRIEVGDQLVGFQFGGLQDHQNVVYVSQPDQRLSSLPRRQCFCL